MNKNFDYYIGYYNKQIKKCLGKGDYSKTIECFLKLKNILEIEPNRDFTYYYAVLLDALGMLYYKIGDYAHAKKYCLESKDIRIIILDREHTDYILSLNHLGTIYDEMGDYDSAEIALLEAKSICEGSDKENSGYAASLNGLGVLYCRNGDYNRAEKCYRESKDIWEKKLGKKHPYYATSLNNLGMIYNKMGDYVRAEKSLFEAKSIYEELGKENSDYAILIDNLGELYCYMMDYARAEKCYRESKDIWEKILGKNHPDYAVSLNNLGVLYHDKGDYARAKECYLKAISIYKRKFGKEHIYHINLLNNLSMLYLTMKDYKRALNLKKESNKLNMNYVNRIFSFLSSREREKYWNTNSFFFELSYSFSCFYPVLESNAFNYNNAMFAKGLLLRTANTVRDSIHSSGDNNLIAQYDEFINLRQRIRNLQQIADKNEKNIESLEDQAEKLDKYLTQKSATFREFNADLSLNWQDVRDSLQPGEAAIEFVSFKLFDKKWTTAVIQYAALVLRPKMRAPEWISLTNCEKKLSEFLKKQNEKTNGKEKNIYDEYGSELYTAIWQPLEKILEGVTSVYYSPSGLLHKISLNAILVKEGLRLADVYDLNLVSSTREIVRRGNKTPQKPDSGVVYGGLQYTEDEETMKKAAQLYNTPDAENKEKIDLPDMLLKKTDPPDILRKSNTLQQRWDKMIYSEKEGRDIQKIMSENNIPVDLYMNAEGNKESFMNLGGKKKSVIHLATHGFFFGNIEKNYEERHLLELLGVGPKVFENLLLRSGLVLSGGNNAWEGKTVAGVENGILFADDVANMDLVGAQLVVLSACETALGEVNNSEGVFGLQRAFKLAGAETLIMSLWNVSDRATSELMSSFYKKWLSGNSKQEAFKEAQRQLRAKPEYSSPFYWAAFVMID